MIDSLEATNLYMLSKAFTRATIRELEDKWYERAVNMASQYALAYMRTNSQLYSKIVLDPKLKAEYDQLRQEV